VLESAQAVGLQHCPPGRRDALKADSFGLGQLLLAVHAAGVRRAWVGLGGSATTDGGQGLARALGWRLLDAQGAPIGPGGGGLRTLSRILAPRKRALGGLRLKVLCDVRNPLSGAEGAAAVYGPQKGAGPKEVRILDQALRRLARCLPSVDPGIAGAGAAGGLGFGLQAFAGATLVPGAETLLQLAGFDRLAAGADCILSGEGRLDRQSLRGKLPWAVAAAAQRQGRPCVLFCGQISLGPRALAQARLRAVQVSPSGPPPLRSSEAAADLRKAVQAWAGLLQTSGPVSDRKN
jgi:glycerate kinase